MTERTSGSAASREAAPYANQTLPWRAMLGIGMGVFMATVDMSIVNITLSTLMVELEVSLATVEWVVLSYALVVTSLMLGVARVGDMLGKKRVYLCGLAVFTLGSLLCGAAPGTFTLIAFRGLQALGAVMMQALGVAIITDIVPPSRRGRALGLMGSVVGLGLAVGPLLGGCSSAWWAGGPSSWSTCPWASWPWQWSNATSPPTPRPQAARPSTPPGP